MTGTGRTPVARWATRWGIASLIPYAAVKTYWACGGSAGKPSGFDLAAEFERNGSPEALVWMERHGIDFTAVLAAVGAVLLLALSRPWGRAMPRWSLLAPAWSGAVLLVPYGVLTVGAWATGYHVDGEPRFSSWFVLSGVIAFCGFGSALAVCAWSIRRRPAPPTAADAAAAATAVIGAPEA